MKSLLGTLFTVFLALFGTRALPCLEGAVGIATTYDGAAYSYDAPVRLSLPDTVATDARGSASRPRVAPGVSHVSVGRFGVAADGGAVVPNPKAQLLPNGAPNRGPAAWVNEMDDTGTVITHASSPGIHAEVAAQTAVPGAWMSEVCAWRGPTSAPTWQRIPICPARQSQIPPSFFPPGVLADPGPLGAK